MTSPALNAPLRSPIGFQLNDGGRAAAGFKGHAGDCVTRAVAIATGLPYQQVYDQVNAAAGHERPGSKRRRGRRSAARTGVFKATTHRVLRELGWSWVPTMAIGTGCTVHLRADELPSGRLVVALSRHCAAVIDGIVHDLDPDVARDGRRCVYGYWQEAA